MSTMPFAQLADEIIRLSDADVSTPVLVTPSYLSLRRAFIVELAGTLSQKSDRPVRIDWYRCGGGGLMGLISQWWALRRATSINRSLRRRATLLQSQSLEVNASVQVTAAIGRPGGIANVLVVGLCDERHELSGWTTPIRIGGSPIGCGDLQFS